MCGSVGGLTMARKDDIFNIMIKMSINKENGK